MWLIYESRYGNLSSDTAAPLRASLCWAGGICVICNSEFLRKNIGILILKDSARKQGNDKGLKFAFRRKAKRKGPTHVSSVLETHERIHQGRERNDCRHQASPPFL